MPGRRVVVQHVGVVQQLLWAHAAGLGQPVDGGFERHVLGGAVDFGAVAGGEQRDLGLLRQAGAKTLQGGGQLIEREREPAAQIERRGLMVDS